jgi:hypothetical protein
MAHLEGKTYAPDDPDLLQVRRWAADFPATLDPADLRGAFFDPATAVTDAILSTRDCGTVRVVDVLWSSVNLAVVDWSACTEGRAQLGDEHIAWTWKAVPFKGSSKEQHSIKRERAAAWAQYNANQQQERLHAVQTAVRATRQLATALRDQGIAEEGDHFAYRAQVVQRQVYRLQRKRGRWLFSGFLDLLAGYGFKPERSLFTYLMVLAAFTGLYMLASIGILTFGLPVTTVKPLAWYEAVVLSVSSFHGRGFFQPLQNPGDPIAILAAIEAVFGLLIEISFIATFTQRYFGAK